MTDCAPEQQDRQTDSIMTVTGRHARAGKSKRQLLTSQSLEQQLRRRVMVSVTPSRMRSNVTLLFSARFQQLTGVVAGETGGEGDCLSLNSGLLKN